MAWHPSRQIESLHHPLPRSALARLGEMLVEQLCRCALAPNMLAKWTAIATSSLLTDYRATGGAQPKRGLG
jgi:hypothetical protein